MGGKISGHGGRHLELNNPGQTTEGQPMLLAQISDFHLYADATRPLLDERGNRVCLPDRHLQQVLDHVMQSGARPDLLLVTGDLSDDGSAESYRRLDRKLAELGIPYHWIPGNHDSVAPMLAELSGNSSHFSAGGWHFALLNSKAWPEDRADGELTESSLEELSEFLRGHTGPTLVAVHHPPLEIDSPWLDDGCPLRNASVLRQLLGRYSQVKAVVFGHAHQFFRRQRRGIGYLGTASTCNQLVPNFDVPRLVGTPPDYQDAPPGYRRLRLNGDGSFDTQEIEVSLRT